MTIDHQTNRPHSVIILHGVGAPQRSLELGEEIFWLSRAMFCRALDHIVKMGSAAPHITFDDGNASDIQIALPELEKRNLKATFFLLAGRLGDQGCLAEADVTTLVQAGHKIGLHGCDHLDWRDLDEKTRTREFIEARAKLSELAGHSVETAAAPFGLYNRETVQNLRALGFTALYTCDRGVAGFQNFIRPRNCLEGSMSEATLMDALQGHVRPRRKMRRLLGIARKRLLPLRIKS